MQRQLVNEPSYPLTSKTKYNNQDKLPQSQKLSSRKSQNGKEIISHLTPLQNDLKVYDDDDFDLAPYVARKDKLIQELESSLAEMDDHIVSASKLEDQKTAVEEQRYSLLREIETTVCEIQGHVLNAREMEIEKRAIESECNGLKQQVEHLRTLLDDKQPTNQLNHLDLFDGDESMRASLAHSNSRNQALEKEVKKLRFTNERMHLKEKSNKSYAELEKLRKENADLQKLLQVAEKSEDNIAQELATCHQTMEKMTQSYQRLSNEKSNIEAERNSLVLEKTELETEVKKLRETQDSQNGNVIHKVPVRTTLEKEKELLQRKLQKNEDQCDQLESENTSYKNQIEKLQVQVQTLQTQNQAKSSSDSSAESSNLNQLRPALAKLNKENSELQIELEKAEKEISALKICLEEERAGKMVEDATVTLEKSDKTKAEKPKKTKIIKTKETLGKKFKKEKNVKEVKNKESNEDVSLIEEVEGLKKERFDLKSECQALSETVTKVAGEKRRMGEQIETLTSSKEELESKVTELEVLVKELEVIKETKGELEKQYGDLEASHTETCAELENVNQDNALIHNQLERATGEKDTLLTERKEFQESLEAIKKEMESVRKDVASKSSEIKTLRRKHEEEKKRLVGMKDGGDKELTRMANELKEISGIVFGTQDKELESDSKEVLAAIEKLKKDVEEANQKHEELEKSKNELEQRVQSTDKKASDLEKENAKANDMAMEKAVELSRTKRTLEKKIEKLNKENSEFRKKLGELTPALTISPSISPETIQIQNAQSLESGALPPSPTRQSFAPPQFSVATHVKSIPESSRISREGANIHGPPGPYRGGARHRPPDSYSEGLNLRPGPPPGQYPGGPNSSPGPPGPYPGGPNSRYGPQGSKYIPPRGHEPPPYPLTKRKSLDDVMLKEKERNQRYLPPYPGRERRTSDSSNLAGRPYSGSVVTVVAGSAGDKQEVIRSNNNYSSFPRERRRSNGQMHRSTAQEIERYNSEPQSPGKESDPSFQVIGYRKDNKLIQEDYV